MSVSDEITDIETIMNKRIKMELKKDILLDPNINNLKIFFNRNKYTITYNRKGSHIIIIFPENYPFSIPTVIINGTKFILELNIQKYANALISEKLEKKAEDYKKQHIFVPNVTGLMIDGSTRSFDSPDLHIHGYSYDCRNFENKKYQFGSGFIYSILNQFFNHYYLPIPIDIFNSFIDRLLDYPLIKEIGCVYLVLKIYEEMIIDPFDKYINSILENLLSTDVKKLFKESIDSYKKNNSIIIYELVDRLDHLNHILTIYINIWLYTNFNIDNPGKSLDEVSFDLNNIIDRYIKQNLDTELFLWSSQFIRSDINIPEFNGSLFLDNYQYVMVNLRNNSETFIKYIRDLLIIIKNFNNLSNDMFDTTNKIEISIQRHRSIEYKRTNPIIKRIPSSLSRIETDEYRFFQNLEIILGYDVSLILPGSICENIKDK